jgi:hypothetical protein
MNILLIIFYCFELLAFTASVFYWKKIRNTRYKWFTIYLGYIILADLTGNYITSRGLPNSPFFNYCVIPVEFLFFYWLLYKAAPPRGALKLHGVAAGVYLLSFIVDACYFSRRIYPFYSLSYSVGNLLLLILILSFFYQLINSDAVLTYRSNMMFWICAGLLVFYLGSCPYYGLRNTFAYTYISINILYSKIVLILDCFMYLLFTFSFIWGKPNLRSSSY